MWCLGQPSPPPNYEHPLPSPFPQPAQRPLDGNYCLTEAAGRKVRKQIPPSTTPHTDRNPPDLNSLPTDRITLESPFPPTRSDTSRDEDLSITFWNTRHATQDIIQKSEKWRRCPLPPSIPRAMSVSTASHPRLSASCSSVGSNSMSSALVSCSPSSFRSS